MPLMTVEVCIWHLWLWRSVYGIYGCGGLCMAFMVFDVQCMSLMAVEVCIWHLWRWMSAYGIYGC